MNLFSVFVRDLCHCDTCFDAQLRQRRYGKDVKEHALDLTVETVAVAHDGVSVTFSDAHTAVIAAERLFYAGVARSALTLREPTLWTASTMEARGGVPTVPFAQLMAGDKIDLNILNAVYDLGFVLVTDAPLTSDDAADRALVERFGAFSPSMWGDVQVSDPPLVPAHATVCD